MSTALVAPGGFSQEQIDIIKSQVAPKGTTNDELAMFLQYCQRTGLDPFARQIYLSERRSKNQQTGQWDVKRVPETTIDGFRVIAERSRQYAGQLGPFWCGEDGQWVDVWVPQKPPVAAKVGILRHDFKEPLWAVALYDEYVQTKSDGHPNSMWAKMPANQLAKCAESLGHRKAFPRELSGLYTREEMPTEQHEAKEAQKEYLASKGLEPFKAHKSIGAPMPVAIDVLMPAESGSEASLTAGRNPVVEPHRGDAGTNQPAGSPTSAQTIRELADTLDQPPSTKTIEMRHASKVAEADAALGEVKKAPKRPRGGVGFDALKALGEIKKMLLDVTGTTEEYYAVLRANGFEHADAITDNDKAREIYRSLLLVHNQARADKVLREELLLAESMYGSRFKDVLGANGCLSIDDVLCLSADPLRTLREELRALGRS